MLWDWSKFSGDKYRIPAREIFYLLFRWKSGADLLDLGCGQGRHTELFAREGFRVVALDNSETALEQIRVNIEEKEYKKNIQIVNSDIKKIDAKDDTFDYLIGYHVISHTNSKEINEILQEVYRVMKPNGELFLTFCSKESRHFKKDYLVKLDESTILKNTNGYEKDIPHFYANEEELVSLLSKHKLEIIDLFHTDNYYENGRLIDDDKHLYVLCRKGNGNAG